MLSVPYSPLLLINLRQTRVCWGLHKILFCLTTLSVFPLEVTFYFYFEHRDFPKVLVLWLNCVRFFPQEGKFSANLAYFMSPHPCKSLCIQLDWVGFASFIISNHFLSSLAYLRDFSWVKWPLLPTGQIISLLVTTRHLSSLVHKLRRSRLWGDFVGCNRLWSVFQSLLHPKNSLVTPIFGTDNDTWLFSYPFHVVVPGLTHHPVAMKDLVCIVFTTRCWFFKSQNVGKDHCWWLLVYWKVSYNFYMF